MDFVKTLLDHGLYIAGHIAGGMIGGIIAGIALVFWLHSVRSSKWREFILAPETWLAKYRTRKQPSATQHFLNCSDTFLKKLKKSNIENQAQFQKMLTDSFEGRSHLFTPIIHHISEVIDNSRNISTKSIRGELENWVERLHRVVADSHQQIGNLCADLLENIDGSLVKTLVLADYSTPVAEALRELGRRHKSLEKAVDVYLVQSSRHFISSQDTNRWMSLLFEDDCRLFNLKTELFSLDQCWTLFGLLNRKRSALLTGTERIYTSGHVAVFPGVGLLARAAAQQGLQVIVATESYKVQPLRENEIEGLGSDSKNNPTTLELFEIGKNMHLITDHRSHEHLDGRTSESFHCCYRHWRNKMGGLNHPIGIIFDLDGTIVDSETVHRELFIQSAERIGYELTKEEYEVALIGQSDADIMKYLLNKKPKARLSERDLIYNKQKKYHEYITNGKLKAVPGAVPFIKMLADNNFPLAVATSATSDELNICLEALGISDCFKTVLSIEMVKNGKPSPDIYLEALTRLRILPSEGLVYEDSIAGVKAAFGAGISVIGVGLAIRDQLSEAGARAVIPDFIGHALPESTS